MEMNQKNYNPERPLLNHKMEDGSRKFAELPQSLPWHELRDYLQKKNGIVVINLLTDGVTEGWIDFSYRGHSFTVNDQIGDYWFFVDEPACPDEVLNEIVTHCQVLLRK
jgi:hypothetical protein